MISQLFEFSRRRSGTASSNRRGSYSAAARFRAEPLEERRMLTITVTFETSLGNFDVDLFDEETPATVQNFLNYINDGDYLNSIVHRSAKLQTGGDFVVQGGGFRTDLTRIPTDPPVMNEPGISNLRGTIAMAKLGGDPNSATSQWFINLGDNSFLDSEMSGAFTVFGEVVGDGMDIVDAIADVDRFDIRSIDPVDFGAFNEIPLRNYTETDPLTTPTTDQLIVVHSISVKTSPNLGRITGMAYFDTNVNGTREVNEAGLSNVLVFLDINNDGTVQAGEPQTTTDAAGFYQFNQLAAGDYTIQIVPRDAHALTSPDSGRRNVSLDPAETIDAQDFGSVIVAQPINLDLLTVSDTGSSTTDNITLLNNSGEQSRLSISADGVIPGATVEIFSGNQLLGQATATGDTVTIESDGNAILADGVQPLVARQTFNNITSGNSVPLNITIDTRPAEFTSLDPSPASVGSVFNYDADTDEDDLGGMAFELFNAPSGMAIDSASGVVTWTPAANQAGSQTFGVRAIDRAGNVREKTFSVQVRPENNPPVAAADFFELDEDADFAVEPMWGVLKNDTDADGDALTAVLAEGPEHGELTFNPDGSFRYVPNQDFNGVDTFTYRATDGIDMSEPQTVTLNVRAIEDQPEAIDDAYVTGEDDTLTATVAEGVLANDLDGDGDVLAASLVDGPESGELTFETDGSFTYVPAPQFSGTVTFTYRISDGKAESATATVTVTVQNQNDPPVAIADSFEVMEDTTLQVNAGGGVLANDNDEENDTLSARVIAGPSHGTLTLTRDGSFSYEPDADFFGTDSFTYVANDGESDSAEVAVTIEVIPADDPPLIAAIENRNAQSGQEVVINATATDVDGDTDGIQFSLAEGSEHGASIDEETGEFRWIPSSSQTGDFRFTIRATDTAALSSEVSFIIAVDDFDAFGVALAGFSDLNQTLDIPESPQIPQPTFVPVEPAPPDEALRIPEESPLSRIQSGSWMPAAAEANRINGTDENPAPQNSREQAANPVTPRITTASGENRRTTAKPNQDSMIREIHGRAVPVSPAIYVNDAFTSWTNDSSDALDETTSGQDEVNADTAGPSIPVSHDVESKGLGDTDGTLAAASFAAALAVGLLPNEVRRKNRSKDGRGEARNQTVRARTHNVRLNETWLRLG